MSKFLYAFVMKLCVKLDVKFLMESQRKFIKRFKSFEIFYSTLQIENKGPIIFLATVHMNFHKKLPVKFQKKNSDGISEEISYEMS